MGDEPLRAAQHPPQVVIAALLEDPGELGEGEDKEDLVVDVGELDGDLVGGEAVPADAHQDERCLVEEGDDGGCGRSLEKRNARRNVNALLKNNAFTFKIFKSNDIIYVFHYTAMTREKIRKKHRGDASVKRREAGRVDKNMTSAQPGVSN